jgi:hypothetical protein
MSNPYISLPHERAHEATNYMTYDLFSNNPYNYKDLGNNFNTYQKYQDLYYFTKNPLPISLVNLSPQMMDPSNLPVDQPNIYKGVTTNDLDYRNVYQSNFNNPDLWRDNNPPKSYYYSQYEHLLPGVPKQQSAVKIGAANSFTEFHGMQLY